ncbi:MAG: cobalamin-dependent protein [Clostridia bacterium]|nr:cobalamin-dependent protein [Clostridia bacterium]
MCKETKPLRLKKSDLLQHAPIRCEAFSCKTVFGTEVSLSGLYTHEILEISMVTEGNGFHRILNQTVPCKAGDLYIVSSNVPHAYFLSETKEPMTVRHLLFDPKDWFPPEIAAPGNPRFCYGVFNDNPVTAYAMMNTQTQKEMHDLFDSISEEIKEQKNEWRDAVQAYLTHFLIKISRYINGTIKKFPNAPTKEWNTVLSALRMMMERFDDPSLTLETISDSLYISKSHLSRLFKRLTGEIFSDSLRDIRMDRACRLLSESNMTVEEIMTHCGLRDMPSFYRNFNAYTKMTPHQYRLAHSGKNSSESLKKEENQGLVIHEISENLQAGQSKQIKELILQALETGASAQKILKDGLLHGMNIVGEKFKNNEAFVPEVLVAARAMNIGMQTLKPYLTENGTAVRGRVCIGTVKGDLHDIGKNLVRMMMEGKGLEVFDLGVDVAPEDFVRTAIEKNCRIICCSALLTTTMSVMEEVVRECEKAGIREKVKILIGGAPVSAEFCKQIGADCYTVDAASAAQAAAEFYKIINKEEVEFS